MRKRDGLVPAMFADAASADPAVREWAVQCAAGAAPSLLVLGAHWSGKTRTMYAALRTALGHGVDARTVAVPDAIDFTSEKARHVLSTSRVVLVDPADWADPEYGHDVDGLKSYEPRDPSGRAWDEPDLQAVMAVRDAAWQQLIERLTFSVEHASVFTATSEWTLRRALPGALVGTLLDRPRIQLARRPRPRVEW